MLRRNNNISQVVISADAALTTNLPAVGDTVSEQNLEAGAVVLTDVALRRLDAAAFTALAAGDRVFIVQSLGASKPLLKSPILSKGGFVTSTQKFLPATEQVTIIGFNGTTGSLPVANDTSYFIKIRKNDNDAGNRSQPFSLFAQYKTDSTGTQEELAFGLAEIGTANFKLEPANGYLKFEVTSDTAAGTATTAAVTNGSRAITLAVAGTAAVGDVITITDTAAATDSAYKIIKIVGTAVTLDYAYQGATEAAAVVDYNPVAGTNFGIRITGKAADFDVTSFRNYYKNRFTATFSDSSATVTHVQGAFEGVGSPERVALDEYQSWGFEGQNEMIGVPPKAREQEALTGVKYSAVELGWTEDVNHLVGSAHGKGSLVIYTQLGAGDVLATSGNTGEELVTALGLIASDLDA